jgi:putative alpha-1,2-mannosidase
VKKVSAVFFLIVLLAAAGGLTMSDRLAAGHPTSAAANSTAMRFVERPTLESATSTSATVRWETNNVPGTTVRYGVVHFGVDPRNVNQTAKSQNRWNRNLPSMIYRVYVDNLEPGLTYYYTVESTDATGVSEATSSELLQFTTPTQR